MSAYSTLILSEPGLTSYHRLNDSTSTVMVDSFGAFSATSVTAVTYGQPSLLPSESDTGASFNGTTSTAVCPAMTSVASGFSLEAWVKMAAVGAWRRFAHVLSSFSWGVDDTNHFVFTINSTPADFISTVSFTAGPIYHVVMTFDGSLDIRWYVNGVLQQTDTTPAVGVVPGAGTLEIGSTATPTEFMSGVMQEHAIYLGSVLTQAQITNHWRLGSGNNIPAYKFNPIPFLPKGQRSG